MTVAVSNTLGNGRQVKVEDILGSTTSMEKFVEENKEFFDNYLMLDRTAWASDEAHARKYGSVLCLPFDAAGEYKYETRFTVADYLRDPRGYNRERSNLPFRRRGEIVPIDEPYKGYLTGVIIPIGNATERQKGQFETVSTFMASMSAEWLQRVGLNAEAASHLRKQLANPAVPSDGLYVDALKSAVPAEDAPISQEMIASTEQMEAAVALATSADHQPVAQT